MKQQSGIRSVLVLLTGLTLIPCLAADLTGSPACTRPGGQALVTIQLGNVTDEVAEQMDLLYTPSVLTPAAPMLGSAALSHLLDWRVTSPNVLRVVIYSDTNAPLLNGELVGVPFTVAPGASTVDYEVQIPVRGLGTPPYEGPGAIFVDSGALKSPSATTVSAIVQVIAVHNPTEVTQCIGGTATFSCSADRGGPYSYQWFRGTDPIPGAVASVYTDPDSEPEEAGYYSCRMTADCGSFDSDPAPLSIIETACSPTELKAYDPGVSGSVNLRWHRNPSPLVTNYRVYWSIEEGGPYTNFRDVGVSSETVLTGLADGIRHFFRTSAFIEYDESQFSNEANAVPTGDGRYLPQAPDLGYRTTPSNDTAHPDVVTYRFPARAGAVDINYDIYDVDSVGEVVVLVNGIEVAQPATTPNSSWSGMRFLTISDDLVQDGSENVLTFDETGYPPVSEIWGVRKASIRIPAPSLRTTARNLTVDLTFQQDRSETTLKHYDIFRSTDPIFVPSTANRIATNVHGIWYRDASGLTNGTTYYYIVRPIDTIDNRGTDTGRVSAAPSNAEVTPVVDLRVRRTGSADITLEWSAVTTQGGIRHYKVYESEIPMALTFTGQTTTETSFVRTGDQSDGRLHFYSIRPVDTTGREALE